MKPIFIGGCSRSGTTLLGAMLGSHSECLCVPESQFKIDVLRYSYQNKRDSDIEYILDKIKNHWRFKLDFNIDLGSVPLAEIGSSFPELIRWIVHKYGEKLGKLNPNIWVDHTPSNIRYVATLFQHFPEAKIIHIVRDGRAVAASIMRLDWGPNTINTAAHFWIDRVAYGLAAESFWGGGRVMRITYEELVKEPEITLKRLCRWLDIDYQNGMVKANDFIVPEYVAGQHALIGKLPNAERINAWEKVLTPRQIEVFESLTCDFLRYFGYAPKYGLKARSMTRMERFIWGIRGMFMRYVINKIRYKVRIQKVNIKDSLNRINKREDSEPSHFFHHKR